MTTILTFNSMNHFEKEMLLAKVEHKNFLHKLNFCREDTNLSQELIDYLSDILKLKKEAQNGNTKKK